MRANDEGHRAYLRRRKRRVPQEILWCVFVALLVNAHATLAQGAAGPEAQVSKLINAYEQNDFKTIFDMSVAYQSRVAIIKQNNPQVMWQQLTNEYFQAAEKDYAARARVPNSTFSVVGEFMPGPALGMSSSVDNPADCSLRSLLYARPRWKILETRSTSWQDNSTGARLLGTLVYAELNFNAPESSPLFGEGLLKKVIVAVTLEGPEKLFLSAKAVPKSDILWTNPPLRLLSVQWNTILGQQVFGPHDTVLGYNVLGGVPPYTSETRCGPVVPEEVGKSSGFSPNSSIYGSPQESPTDTLRIQFGEPQGQHFPLPCVVKVTDSSGQSDTATFVVPVLESQLWSPFCWIRNPWYAWKEGLPNARQGCEKLYELENGAVAQNVEQSGDANTENASNVASGSSGSASRVSPVPNSGAACGGYQSCIRAGTAAFQYGNLAAAISAFESATRLQPRTGEAWVWLGRAYLRGGQNSQAWNSWDSALGTGGTISIGVCHQLAFRPCQTGDLELNSRSISFVANGSQSIFNARASAVSAKGVFNNPVLANASFGLEVEGKKYNFNFLPLGIGCRVALLVQCPQQGVAQQLAVANYIQQVVPKLASGAFVSPSAPVPTRSSAGPSTAATASSSACENAASLGYSIQDGGRVYMVKGIGPAGPNQIHVFTDESGAAVHDSSLLQTLALGAWTKERIIDRYNSRGGSGQVRAFLAVSGNLEGWEDATDALARATVESIKAVVSGGASLDTVAQNLTLGIAKNQLTNPKLELAHWARAGLDQSLADYIQMESLMPADGTAVYKLSDLEKIDSLYTEANTLSSVNEALAAAIAPTTWQAEFASYLSSAVDQLKPALPTSAALLTLSDVLKLEQLVAATGQSFDGYERSLNLALKVARSNQQSISQWAASAAAACGAPVAGNGSTFSTSTNRNIRDVNFRDFTYPSGCAKSDPGLGFPAAIPVVNGAWKKGALGQDLISYSVGAPLYGQLLGSAYEQAVVSADCFLGNGDDEEVFVYGMTDAEPMLIQRLTPSDWTVPAWGIAWVTKSIQVEDEEIKVTYLAGGFRARPAWIAEVALRWNGTRFVRASTDRRPFTR